MSDIDYLHVFPQKKISYNVFTWYGIVFALFYLSPPGNLVLLQTDHQVNILFRCVWMRRMHRYCVCVLRFPRSRPTFLPTGVLGAPRRRSPHCLVHCMQAGGLLITWSAGPQNRKNKIEVRHCLKSPLNLYCIKQNVNYI